MAFNEPLYFVFFIVVTILFYTLPASSAVFLLTLASYFFYAGWNYAFLPLILISTLIDFVCGYYIDTATTRRRKRFFLVASVVSNLSILAVFKYLDCFIVWTNFTTGLSVKTLQITLPVGISFFTFQSMSYTIDLYRGKIPREKSFLHFACYVSFFSQLVAGPIVRAREFLPQLKALKPRPSANLILEGGSRFCTGYLKKALADILALKVVEPVFNDIAQYNSPSCLVAVICFGIQIYFDFAGYTDMAIGSARILGFRLPKNFNFPYLSRSLTEFWRRWHISLSSWFRDYLYISLGGNRSHLYRNLMITLVLAGFWHGARLNFVLWGLFHGFLLVVERRFNIYEKVNKAGGLSGFVHYGLTMVLVFYGWILFRVENMQQALLFTKKIFYFQMHNGDGIRLYDVLYISMGAFILHHVWGAVKENSPQLGSRLIARWQNHWGLRTASYVVAFSFVIFFLRAERNPFIYFQF